MRFSPRNAAFAASLLTISGCVSAPPPTTTPAFVPAVQLYADEPMPRSDLLRIQVLLDNLDYSVGTVDGVIGWRTRRSIESFQRDSGLPINGYYSYALLDDLGHAVNGRTVATASQPARQVRKAAKAAPATRTKATARTSAPAKATSATKTTAATPAEARPTEATRPAAQTADATAPTAGSSQEPSLIDSLGDVLADAAETLTTDTGTSGSRFCEPDCEGAGGGGGGGGGWN